MLRVISRKKLKEFWVEYPDSENYLKTWYNVITKSNWQNPHDIKAYYPHASILRDDRVVFNIKGNSYRSIVKINFNKQLVFVRFIGKHSDYDKIDANTI